MGGSGGGGGYFGGPIDPDKLRQEVEEAVDQTERQKRDIAISALLTDLLSAFNSRDYDRTSKHMSEIESALGEEVDGMETLLFGGSVAKHTYVDGLSDIDSLVIIDREEIESSSPAELLDDFAAAVRKNIGDRIGAQVTVGRLAVTVEYADGTVIQLLPAARHRGGFVISDDRGTGWRHIRPKEFTRAIVEANQRLDRALVPTIKLAKSALSNVPEDIRPSGYHVEALALKVLGNYRGDRTPRVMLPEFFKGAADAVMRPTADVTGQSKHIDSHLGESGSDSRRRLSAVLERIARKLENARSAAQWRDVLEPQES
jgi:hypothetical protein